MSLFVVVWAYYIQLPKISFIFQQTSKTGYLCIYMYMYILRPTIFNHVLPMQCCGGGGCGREVRGGEEGGGGGGREEGEEGRETMLRGLVLSGCHQITDVGLR